MGLDTRFSPDSGGKLNRKCVSRQVEHSGGNHVAVMQPAKPRQGDDLARALDRRDHNATAGCVLPQTEMSSVFVVITDIVFQQSSQMPLVQDDHVVEQLPTHTPNPALRDTVLPRTSKGGADRFCALLLNRSDDVCRELRVAVKDQKPVWPIVSPNFVQLQYDPQLGRLTSHIAVQNLPPIVADNEEAVQDSEGQRWHRKEVHASDGFAMVAKEFQPASGRIRIVGGTFHPARNGSFRDVETQLEQLSVDAGCSPRWVLRDHAKDQLAHFSADWFSSDCLSSSRDPTPVQPKPCPMPPYDRLRRDQNQRSLPARPNFSQNDPEQPVDGTQSRARSLGVQSQQLLPKGEVLQEECFSGAKDGDDPAEQILKARKHQGIIAKSKPGRCASKSLILRTRGVLARHKDGIGPDRLLRCCVMKLSLIHI